MLSFLSSFLPTVFTYLCLIAALQTFPLSAQWMSGWMRLRWASTRKTLPMKALPALMWCLKWLWSMSSFSYSHTFKKKDYREIREIRWWFWSSWLSLLANCGLNPKTVTRVSDNGCNKKKKPKNYLQLNRMTLTLLYIRKVEFWVSLLTHQITKHWDGSQTWPTIPWAWMRLKN